jgi:hypothetical protein
MAQRHNGTTAQRQNGTTAQRQNGRPADRQNDRPADRQTGRTADRQTSRTAEWQTGRLADWQNGRPAERQNGRKAEWQTGRTAEPQTGRMAERLNSGRMAEWWDCKEQRYGRNGYLPTLFMVHADTNDDDTGTIYSYTIDKLIGPSALIPVMMFSFVYFSQASCVHSFLILLCWVIWNRCESSLAFKHLV